MASRPAPRYPERSSSLSAVDFPHGPPNSPTSNTASPMSLNTALSIVPDDDIPQLSLQDKKAKQKAKEKDKEIKLVTHVQRSLSNLQIKEPIVEEFTFEGKDGEVRSGEVEGGCGLLSASLSQEDVSASAIVRPSTPMVPLMFGRKSKTVVADDEENKDLAGAEKTKTKTKTDDSDVPLDSGLTDGASVRVKVDSEEVTVSAVAEIPLCLESTDVSVIKTNDVNDVPRTTTKGCVVLYTSTEIPQRIVAVPATENYKENKLVLKELTQKKKTIVVAISGCSSAGKSLLAKILSTVFSSTSIAVTNEASLSKPATIIAQDDFFLPKALQPFITFISCPADAHFMEKSIHRDEVGMYCIASSGSRPPHPPDSLETCIPGSLHAQRTDSFDSTNSDASRVVEGGHRPRYQVTGPMPDCDQAINFVGLVEAITSVKSTSQLTHYTKHFQCNEDMEKFSALIEKMKDKVSAWVKEQVVLNAEARYGGYIVRGPIETDGKKVVGAEDNSKESLRSQFVFVEGFLLLAQPDNKTKKTYDILAEKAKIEKYTAQLESLSSELTAKNNVDAGIEGERDVIEAQLWATNLVAKRYMQGLFDVKLFLNTSKGESKRRRFERSIYTDAPAGGRLPGQMWKSEGFFEEGVWKGFEDSYSWLLETEAMKRVKGKELVIEQGVFIEPVQDAEVDVCVEWAVDVLLTEMGKIEAEARIASGGCCIDD